MTVTDRVCAGMVTAPAALSTVPADAEAMLLTKAGSSKATGPGSLPVSFSVTASPCVVILTPIRWPLVVGKLETAIWWPDPTQLLGTPRPTISDPSVRWDTSESSRPRSPMAMPHECGDAPPPLAGWLPIHGDVPGGVEPSHQAYGPAWSWLMRNSSARMPSSR